MEDIESAREKSIKEDPLWKEAKVSGDTDKHSEKEAPPDVQVQPSVESRKAKDNIVVISFQKLQLQRIAELQDELLQLTLLAYDETAVKDTEEQAEKADRLLEKYCKHSNPLPCLRY
jgi:hypothetical protein